MERLLSISDLTVRLQGDLGARTLLEGIYMDVNKQEIAALVGSSGGGKTSLGLAALRLLPKAMYVSQGSIFFKGQDLLSLNPLAMQKVRGKEISMVFQDSLSAFNPVFRIGDQIAEVIRAHQNLSRQQAIKRAWELLDLVEIKEARRIASSYPHQLSGGLRQRAMIAQAIAVTPSLVIADEPTSNLDVTIQAKILALFKKLQEQMHLSILLITHDLGVVRFLADRVFILSEGKIVESGDTNCVLGAPKHDLTKKLIKATAI